MLDDVKTQIHKNIERIYCDIDRIAIEKNLDKSNIKLLAVTKGHNIDIIQCAINAGQKLFGENYVQEALPKINYLENIKLYWHFIGKLQKNKIKYIINKFDLIHSIDNIEQVEEIEKRSQEKIKILIQVNLAREKQKSGIDKSEIYNLLDKLEKFCHIKILGLMIIPPFYEDSEKVRLLYQELKFLLDQIKTKDYRNFTGSELSMGMTNDYRIALEEGATIIRIGTGIFGENNT